jgi:hypothetical protein
MLFLPEKLAMNSLTCWLAPPRGFWGRAMTFKPLRDLALLTKAMVRGCLLSFD